MVQMKVGTLKIEYFKLDLRALIVLSLGKQNLHLPHFVSCVDNLRNICAKNNVS